MAKTALALALATTLAGQPANFTRVKPEPWPRWEKPTMATMIAGDAAFYRAGIDMADIAQRRGLDLGGYHGGVALMRSGDLGRAVWILVPGPRWIGPFRSVDCSRRDHYAMNLARRRVVDLDRATWRKLGLPDDLVAVAVAFSKPAALVGPGGAKPR